MTQTTNVNLTVVGSIGIDTVETPREKRESILGGSASFACVAASYFTKVGMVGVVGTDFPDAYRAVYEKAAVNLDGLQVVEGETFRWSGVYEENMDNRTTISTELNVFESFSPDLPGSYRKSPFVFLANISPELQLHVLEQTDAPKFVMADTMDLWINIAREALDEMIGKVDLLTLNESEARHLTGEHSLIKAARQILAMGPKFVIVKKGEHGSMLVSKNGLFLMPAFPLEDFDDPTGAGDTFAGAFMGALTSYDDTSEAAIRKAMLYGSVVASFGVEDFSLDRLSAITKEDIEARATLLREMMRVG